MIKSYDKGMFFIKINYIQAYIVLKHLHYTLCCVIKKIGYHQIFANK